MPARWENVRQQDEIALMFSAGRELQGVEVSVRDADVLCLTACAPSPYIVSNPSHDLGQTQESWGGG